MNRKLRKALIAAGILIGLAGAGSADILIANAAPIWSGNHSVLIRTVNGVTTVIVDGVELHGDDAAPYIDARRRR